MTRRTFTTDEVEAGAAGRMPDLGHQPRLRRGFIVALLAVGWVLLLVATGLSLLASIQAAALGLGALITAVVVATWPSRP